MAGKRKAEKTTATPKVDAGTRACELHFQEGFNGERVVVSLNGAEIVDRTMRTRMQVGVAEVVHAEVKAGDELAVLLPGSGEETRLTLAAEDRYVSIGLENGKPHMQRAEGMPRYA